MLFIKAFTSYFHIYRPPPPSAVASPHRPPSIGLPHRPPSSSDCANGAMRKTAEERFNTLARGWLAYPVTSMHAHLPPKSGCINVIPSVCLPRDALRHTQRAEPPFPGSPALRLNQLLFSYSITFCALPSTTTT